MSRRAGCLNVWGGERRGRVGLLGGSFNPAHDGHRFISLCALQALRLDAVWWLVSPQNPLKARTGMAALADRVRRAQDVAAHPRICVTAIEAATGTRYTADTLQALRRRFRHVRFVWLMGADNLVQMRRWRRWQQIFRMLPVAVFDRGPYAFHALGSAAALSFAAARRPAGCLGSGTPPVWSFVHQPRHPASATAIRQICPDGYC